MLGADYLKKKNSKETNHQINHGKLESKPGEPQRCQVGETGEGSLFLTIS